MTQDAWLIETYYSWLASESFTDNSERREYDGALRVLHDVPFYWTIWSDENRAGDALTFRQSDFLSFQQGLGGLDQAWLHQWAIATPSVLEVLLGIARRWHYYFEAPTQFYFGHLFKNLELDRYPGRVLSSEAAESLRLRLDNWMAHQFQPDGVGSPFPVPGITFINENHQLIDMTKVDIWTQMNVYSAANFQ